MSVNQIVGEVVHSTTPPPKKASTVFAVNSFVEMVSGKAQPATSATEKIYGICDKAVVATDADYALSTQLPIKLVDCEANFLISVGAGTLASANIGDRFGLFNAESIDLTAEGTGVLTLVGKQDGFAIVQVNGASTFVNAVAS